MPLIEIAAPLENARSRIVTGMPVHEVNIFNTFWTDLSSQALFCEMAFARYQEANSEYFKLFGPGLRHDVAVLRKEKGADKKVLDSPMTTNPTLALKTTNVLHFEIEVLFLVSKVYIDKLGKVFPFIYGKAKGFKEIVSHDSLAHRGERFLEQKGLQMFPAGMKIQIDALKSDICDFRDYRIAHKENHRLCRGTSFSLDPEKSSLLYGEMYPGENHNSSLMVSASPHDLINNLTGYTHSVVEYIETTREKWNIHIPRHLSSR